MDVSTKLLSKNALLVFVIILHSVMFNCEMIPVKDISFFSGIEDVSPDELTSLQHQHDMCNDPHKVNLAVEEYRTAENKPYTFPVVDQVKPYVANDATLNYDYLPAQGHADFMSGATKVLLGVQHQVIDDNRVASFQTIGGTGALALGLRFLHSELHLDVIYISNPTSRKHKAVLQRAGFSDIRNYRYWNNEERGLDFAGMKADLLDAPSKSVVILQGAAHDPTGVVPNATQWQEVATICKDRGLFVVMDVSYQGIASGDLNEDAAACRSFADTGMEMMVTQSFSATMGIYSERVGQLMVISDPHSLVLIASQMSSYIRSEYLSPPVHGARFAASILHNVAYYKDWQKQLKKVSERLSLERKELHETLKRLGSREDLSHILEQTGIFTYTGLTELRVEYLKKTCSIFLFSSGQINVSALNTNNMNYVATCIKEAVDAYPSD